MKKRPSIARRLVFLVIVAITPIPAFTGILIARYAEMERAGYDEQMLATARALSLAIDREIAAQHAIVLALSGNSDLLDRNWRAFYDRAKSIMGDDTERRIIVFDPSGQQLLNTLIPYGDELPRSDTRPIREVTESRTPYLSNLVVGAVTGRYAIGIYVPIFQDREVPYVLALGFSPDRFSRLLAEQNLAKGWIASVIDRNGVIAARNVFAATLVGQPITSQFLDTMRAKSDGIIKGKSKDGVPSHGAFVRSAVSQWTTVLGVETAILNAPLWRSLWLLGGGGSLLLVVTLGGTALYARRIARPVVALASMAGSMQRDEPLGDLDLDLQEAQFVADQIRNAATQLEERRAEREALLASLELRVEARTRDLADSEARYRLLADNATDLIVHSGMDRIWHYVSPSCRQMLGYEPEEMIGKSPTHLVHPEDSEPLAKAIGQLRPGYERTTAVYRVRRKDGIYVWIETSFNLIIDTKSGRPVSIVSVARDITARKDAEERAERAAAQAITANQAKSEFLASMSHELRTPLNAVIGFAQLLIYGKGPPLVPRQREYVDFILSGANHLLELIKDVLDLAKIESGRLRVSIEWVDVGTLIEEFVAMLRPIAEQKGLSLTSEPLQLRYPAIRADRVWLLQVLMNFGSNAVKYNRPNGSIIVRARPTAE